VIPKLGFTVQVASSRVSRLYRFKRDWSITQIQGTNGLLVQCWFQTVVTLEGKYANISVSNASSSSFIGSLAKTELQIDTLPFL